MRPGRAATPPAQGRSSPAGASACRTLCTAGCPRRGCSPSARGAPCDRWAGDPSTNQGCVLPTLSSARGLGPPHHPTALTTLNTLDTSTSTLTSRGALPFLGIWVLSRSSRRELRSGGGEGQMEGWRSRSPKCPNPRVTNLTSTYPRPARGSWAPELRARCCPAPGRRDGAGSSEPSSGHRSSSVSCNSYSSHFLWAGRSVGGICSVQGPWALDIAPPPKLCKHPKTKLGAQPHPPAPVPVPLYFHHLEPVALLTTQRGGWAEPGPPTSP